MKWYRKKSRRDYSSNNKINNNKYSSNMITMIIMIINNTKIGIRVMITKTKTSNNNSNNSSRINKIIQVMVNLIIWNTILIKRQPKLLRNNPKMKKRKVE